MKKVDIKQTASEILLSVEGKLVVIVNEYGDINIREEDAELFKSALKKLRVQVKCDCTWFQPSVEGRVFYISKSKLNMVIGCLSSFARMVSIPEERQQLEAAVN